jgi:hypothetical protein
VCFAINSTVTTVSSRAATLQTSLLTPKCQRQPPPRQYALPTSPSLIFRFLICMFLLRLFTLPGPFTNKNLTVTVPGRKKNVPRAPSARFARNHDGPQADDSGHAACHCVARTLLSVLGMTHSLNAFRENRAAALTHHTVTSCAKSRALPRFAPKHNAVSGKSDAKFTPFYFQIPVYGTPPPSASRVKQ